MSNLISRLRLTIQDPAGDSQTFSDAELQNILDKRTSRRLLRHLMDKDVEEKKYFVGWGDLEEYTDADGYFHVWDGSGESADEITGYTADYIRGILTFTSDQDDDYYVDAVSYNLDHAAAVCFEIMAADLDRARYWGRGGVQFSSYDLMELARQKWREGGPITTKVGRVYNG